MEEWTRNPERRSEGERELLIGTQFSILYTSVYPAVSGD